MNEYPSLPYVVAGVLLPPVSLLLLALLGLWLARRPRRVGRLGLALAFACVGLLLTLSVPAVAYALARTLEAPPLINSRAAAEAQAIVILAGGSSRGAPEYGGASLNTTTLQRVRYGANLARETGLPVLVSGGAPTGGIAEAALMRDTLEREFMVPARWVEDRSRTTAENARFSAALLRDAGISRVALVTTAMHVPRAAAAFEAAGLRVVPAPTGYFGQAGFRWTHLVPRPEGIALSYRALREWLAIAVYRWRDDA